MTSFKRAIGGTLLFAGLATGSFAYEAEMRNQVHERIAACYEQLDGSEATECADRSGYRNLALGIAQLGGVVTSLAFGAQVYRLTREGHDNMPANTPTA